MNTQFEGFEPIHTIFFSIFHPTEGSKVCYQFPPENLQAYNINFDSIKNFVIPKPQLCHRLLTLEYKNYRLVSYPVNVSSSSYARNFFSFNFVFIFSYDCQTLPYEPAIERLGKMFKTLEEQSQILSKSQRTSAFFKDGEDVDFVDTKFSIQDLLMRLYQDLNNYSECLIPIDEGNEINIKIFPVLKPPTSVQISIEDVPLSIVNLDKIVDLNWDPTMLSILPFIDGVNSITNISHLSDSDPNLVIECIKHLIYYNCVIITDIFQFSNIYAPSSLINNFLRDPMIAFNCQSYVVLPPGSKINDLPLASEQDDEINNSDMTQKALSSSRSSFSSYFSHKSAYARVSETAHHHQSTSTLSSSEGQQDNPRQGQVLPSKCTLFDLYRSLNYGCTVEAWYKQNFSTIKENHIDVRKFIKFGVINKIIYRVHQYPIMEHKTFKSPLLSDRQNDKIVLSTSDIKFDVGDRILNSIYNKLSKVTFDRDKKLESKIGNSRNLGESEKNILFNALERHESFDRICSKLGKSKNEVESIISEIGEYMTINS
ncbi:hypothetical protein KAFR_0L00380 [Kazachstania africana CBS 2517]|uniref:Nitrogen permease regulator 2 n=1 Tax=Kazachstania africana (strain ATCC 22294 / BCRC 22015 / CBS 2517 / CECT 1963 / NBRC 1671 / NRRL Y-8276) TaxID=1071382 RepID=H2B1Z5_KAZAF|nr:hypothetical protein KAFR_0L00380 [Kazachstania africana CBS 2517]CCF60645.1 hypothetical protein KAFR_0L00380 [Kazachstania africana CBS 2517]